ncbi:MAG: histidine phosphatase family protein [Chloroflexi bacterium]|nr:histidine phosphatase family protein [Chloroflexota bacterium]
MKIFLLRHGESVDDVEDAYGGIADFPLTDSGRQTAKALAGRLSGSGIEILYSSPYKRAHETATIVGNALNCKVEVVPDLRERNSYGVLSGVNKAKAKEVFSHILDQLKNKPGDYYSDELVPGAEPLPEFNSRVKRAFEEVIRNASGRNVIGVVTHGNVTRSIYRHILGVQGKVELELLAITVLDYQTGKVIIERKEGIEIKP